MGIRDLTISIDAYNKKTYEYIRKLPYDVVIKNINNVIKWKKKLNSKTKISLFYVKMINNENEVESFLKKWRKKVDDITIADFSVYTYKIPDLRTKQQKNNPRNNIKFPCPKLWSDLTVMADGKVALCCQDFDGKEVIGDTNKQSLLEIFNGKKIKKIREQHLKGEFSKTKLCSKCNWYEIPNFHMALYPRIPILKKMI